MTIKNNRYRYLLMLLTILFTISSSILTYFYIKYNKNEISHENTMESYKKSIENSKEIKNRITEQLNSLETSEDEKIRNTIHKDELITIVNERIKIFNQSIQELLDVELIPISVRVHDMYFNVAIIRIGIKMTNPNDPKYNINIYAKILQNMLKKLDKDNLVYKIEKVKDNIYDIYYKKKQT